MTGLTREVAAFVATLDPETIPDVSTKAALMGITDCVGTMIAGADEDAPRLLAEVIAPPHDPSGAPVLPSGRLVAAPEAALLNGVAAHVLDYDDVGLDGHPSTVLAPTILAEGWVRGTSGADALAAYVAGYEVWALLSELEPGMMHDRGFHPTAVKGTVAAAAAAARLNGLGAERTGHAIAIGASLAAGLVANFGTMTKSLHAGRTAQSGIMAARLAAAGMTGAPDVLEHNVGFLAAHSASGQPDTAARDHELGKRWRLPEIGIHIKCYPLCYSTHRAIDAMLQIVEANDLKPRDVRQVRVGAGATQLLMLRNHAPQTGLEAKFSMEFAMASALVARKVGLAELSDTFVRRPEVIEAMMKVRSRAIHDGIVGLPDSEPDEVEVELVDGTVLTCPPVAHARGSWQKPLDWTGLYEKFIDCAAGPTGRATAERIFAGLGALPGLADLRALPLSDQEDTARHSA